MLEVVLSLDYEAMNYKADLLDINAKGAILYCTLKNVPAICVK